MQNITGIIVKIITLPFTIIKWIFYFILTYIFLFSVGFIIDRYVGWHPAIKPIRDSSITITFGILKKITPYLQKIAYQFDKDQQAIEPEAGVEQQTQEQRVDEENKLSKDDLNQKNLAKATEKQAEFKEKRTEKPNQNLEEISIIKELLSSMNFIQKKINKQQNSIWTPITILLSFCIISMLGINIYIMAYKL